jgi:hypothetical protein
VAPFPTQLVPLDVTIVLLLLIEIVLRVVRH